MKNKSFAGFSLIGLAGLVAALNFGCGPKSQEPSKKPEVASVTKTSFAEVTAQLDPGGDFYLYLGTAQWLDGLSAKLGGLQQQFNAIPGLKPDDAAKISKVFGIVTGIVKDSGIEDVSGVGLSSVEIEKGMFRNKALIHHYAGKGNGFLWQLAGGKPHPLEGLNLLPADTVVAVFSDLELPQVWNVIKKEVSQADLPEAQKWLDSLPDLFEKNTQVKWDTFMNSLGGEFGLVLTLDESNNIPVPLPGAALQVPTPGLMLAIRVNDDTVFNRIDQELKSNPQVIKNDTASFKMRTLPIPVPFIPLRPSAASSGGFLLIASSDALIENAIAIRDGKRQGLAATAEFKRLSQGLPERGNQFAFVSERFTKVLMEVQNQVIAANTKSDAKFAQWMQSFASSQPAFAYSVGVNLPEGCLTIGNGSQSYASSVLLPAVAVPAMLAAIAIPNFVKAREASQRNACINNLRQLDAAKQQWALEKSEPKTAVPTKEDLLPYLRHWPACPAGGTYNLGAVGDSPTCSLPGHELLP